MILGYSSTSTISADFQIAQIKIVPVNGIINSITAKYIERIISESHAENKELIVITLNTPGGSYEATRKIVEAILSSKVPIVSYVYPSGAQAASAGTFILSASHIAAMAPTTNMGAATPVSIGGDELPETLKSKTSQDAAALLRELAKIRDRNIEALEATIFNSKAYSSTESLQNNLIDFIVTDIDDLIQSIDEHKVTLNSKATILKISNPKIETIGMTVQEHFLNFLAQPNITFILLSLGALLIFVEFIFPGLIVPGVAGAIFLALAFLGFNNLPVNYVGIGLMGLSVILMYAEFSAPGISIAGFGSITSFLIGGILLFGNHSISFLPGAAEPSPFLNVQVDLWILILATLILAIPAILAIWDIKKAQKFKPNLVKNIDFLGQPGIAKTILNPKGAVLFQGELWSAESDNNQIIEQNSNIVISDVDGLTLKVFKADKDDIIS